MLLMFGVNERSADRRNRRGEVKRKRRPCSNSAALVRKSMEAYGCLVATPSTGRVAFQARTAFFSRLAIFG